MSKADRYISQNALIKEIAKIHGNLSTKNVGQAMWDTPTADVVEVVRCRDCKYCKKLDIVDVCEHDKNLMINESNPKRVHVLCVTPDHYCSYGEKK